MDRRTTSAIVVLALAALVVIAAWLLRADGAPAPVAEPPATVDPAPAVAPERKPAAFPIRDAPPPPDEASRAPVAGGAARSAPRPPPPRETGDFLIDTARQRAREKDAAWRRAWGPKGRVVEAGSGKPLAWKSCMMQVRRPNDRSVVETRGTDRGTAVEGKPEQLSAFDLRGAVAWRGGEALADVSADDLEYRVVVRAWGYDAASTPWEPLGYGPLGSDLTIALERDEPGELVAMVGNSDGTPFRGTVVADLDDEGGSFRNAVSGTTDANGRVRLSGIPSGAFDVVLRARFPERPDSWQCGALSTGPSRVVIPRGALCEAQFVVPASGSIEIEWRGPDGDAVKGSAVGLQWPGTSVTYSRPVKRVVGILPGRFRLSLVADGFRAWESDVDVLAGQVTKVEARFEKGEDPK